ncbi:hypothetical protein ONZ45_g10835 [Pleurotus djamor]|nr:hypothetical protein ONZ45_g10835 [Pleurotus djamor]
MVKSTVIVKFSLCILLNMVAVTSAAPIMLRRRETEVGADHYDPAPQHYHGRRDEGLSVAEDITHFISKAKDPSLADQLSQMFTAHE